jgi:hypothetical protein
MYGTWICSKCCISCEAEKTFLVREGHPTTSSSSTGRLGQRAAGQCAGVALVPFPLGILKEDARARHPGRIVISTPGNVLNGAGDRNIVPSSWHHNSNDSNKKVQDISAPLYCHSHHGHHGHHDQPTDSGSIVQ